MSPPQKNIFKINQLQLSNITQLLKQTMLKLTIKLKIHEVYVYSVSF